jgi:hypothetical protein
MKPLSILTQQLQSEQLTIPKFKEYWTIAELKLRKEIEESSWGPAKKLIEFLNVRKTTIFGNPIVLAGMYLDPRFQRSLTDIEAAKAKNVIRSVYVKVSGSTESDEVDMETQPEIDNDEITDTGFATLIGSFVGSQTETDSTRRDSITEFFSEYEASIKTRTVTHKTDAIDFWQSHLKNPTSKLQKFSGIALDLICVPVTEVTAERLFSMLNFVYSKLRERLDSSIVEDILLCRWNKKFFESKLSKKLTAKNSLQ